MKTALVTGATGLVGSALIRQLLDHPSYGKVIAFVRKPSGLTHEKLEERVVDFEKIGEWKDALRGDVLFSSMGTTLAKARSKEGQWRVDYTYQYGVAGAAAANGTGCLVLISSAGASDRSMIFYSRMKGELDREVKKLGFPRVRILKPGILAGKRGESRPLEEISIRVMTTLGKIPFLRRYRPYPDHVVASAMIRAAEIEETGCAEYELDEIFGLADRK